MGRSRVSAIKQPDDHSCGPAALKVALSVLGRRMPFATLRVLCKTNRNGTSTKNMLSAIKKLGLPAVMVENATLAHVQSALKKGARAPRAAMVSYLYATHDNGQLDPESGHWAVVAGFKPSVGKIVLLDSYTGQKVSYSWQDFRKRWKDFDWKRIKRGDSYTFVRKWQKQPLVIVAKQQASLPKFSVSCAFVVAPNVH